MEIRQLRTFMESCRALNFTRAANRLGCSQANVTMQIQQLERELGVRLFERLGKRLSLTHAGEKLSRHAEMVIKCIDEAQADVRNSTKSLSIGTAESLCIYRLPVILKNYRAACPDVQLGVKLLNCNDYVSSLENNVVDVLFSLGMRLESSSCIVVGTRNEPVSICASPDHPLTGKKRIGAKDFTKWPVLVTGEGCSYRSAFLQYLESERVYPTIALETNSIQALKQAAINGIGVCVVPHMAVLDEIKRKVLISLPVKNIDWGIVSQVAYHKDKWISPALDSLLAQMEASFSG